MRSKGEVRAEVAAEWHAMLSRLGRPVGDGRFFELGGSSMMAMELLEKVRRRFGVNLSILVFLDHSSLEAFTEVVWNQLNGKEYRVERIVSGRSSFRTSHAQQQLLRLHQLSPTASNAYNESLAWRITGDIDAAILRRAVDALVERHSAFRTRFSYDGLRQFTDQQRPACWHQGDETRGVVSLERALLSISRMREIAFDFETGPLHRFTWFDLEDGGHVLGLTMHHTLVDGQSFALIQRELPELYDAARTGRPSMLPPALEFGEYVEAQLHDIDHGEHLAAEHYFNELLDRGTDDPTLPEDRVWTGQGLYQGEELHRQLHSDLWTAFQQLCRARDLSPAIGLLGLFTATLATWSAQTEFTVGVGASGRALAGSDVMVGYAVNPLPLPLSVDWCQTIEQHFRRTRAAVFEALGHQALPIAAVLARRQQAGPAHRVAFEFLDGFSEAPSNALSLEPHPVGSPFSAFDLKLAVMPLNGAVHVTCQFDRERYAASTIAGFLDTFLHWIGSSIDNDGRQLRAVSLLGTEQRNHVIGLCRGTSEAAGKLIPARIVDCARRRPNALAVVDEQRSVTYGELLAQASEIARVIRASGTAVGDVVALYLHRGADFVAAALGVQLAGAAYLPLDVDNPSGRISALLTSARVRVCLYDARPPDCPGCSSIKLDGRWRNALGEPSERASAELADESPAYVIYTSGSTGTPKGVVVPHRALRNLVQAHRAVTNLGAGDRVAQVTSVAFDPAIEELWPALSIGASVHVAPSELRREPERLVRWICDRGITLAVIPTPIARLLFQQKWPQDAGLRLMLIGGEKLTHQPPEGLPFQVVNCYGPTEAAVWVSCTALDSTDGRRVPTIGRPGVNTQLYVLDSERRLVPPGAPGELHIGGDNLALGYLNDPEQTARSFILGPISESAGNRLYRTGDRVRMLADGHFDFLGRVDDQLKVRGYRLEPSEIESSLMAVGPLREAAVALRSLGSGGSALVASVVLREAASAFDPDELRAGAAKILPEFMLPSLIEVVDALPRGANGKIDRNRLAAMPVRMEAKHSPARDAVELAVLVAARRSLGFPDLGIDDEFFALGGDSLKAVHFAATLRQDHGIDVPLGTLAERRSFGALAEHLRSGQLRPSSVLRLRAGDSGPKIMLFHPIGGNVLCYAALVDRLEPSLDVYGIACPALHDETFAFDTYELLASRYADEMVEHSLADRPVVAGYCAGGVVAHAVAKALELRGHPVSELVLIDTAFPSNVEAVRDEIELMDYFFGELSFLQQARVLESIADQLRRAGPANALGELLVLAKQRGVLPADADESLLRRLLRALELNIHAYHRYRPAPLDCRVTLIQAEQVSPLVANDSAKDATQWCEAVAADTQVVVVPGDHYTMMRPPLVRDLALTISGRLQRRAGSQVVGTAGA